MSRVLAWGAGYGAVFMVAYAYPTLPEELRLTRWTAAPKSLFFALRVPLINLAMIGLCELMARALSRLSREQQLAAQRTSAALLCTAGIKAWLGAQDLIGEPGTGRGLEAFVLVVLGLTLAGWFGLPLLRGGGARVLRFTRVEQALGALLLIAIAVLNLPLVAPQLFL